MSADFTSLSPSAQLLWAFAGGFATSLTPCVYPLIPVTLSIFGASEARSRGQAFLLALSYVFGIASTYTVLGMVSARAGLVFGGFLGSPPVVALLVIALTLLALVTLDLIPSDMLNRLQTAASRVGGRGYSGAFLMGLVSGVVAAPCVGPALVLVLGVAASSQSVIWGALLLFTYALGFGVLFLVLGTFSDLVRLLPRSGNWLYLVKIAMATALLMVALYLLQPFLPPPRGSYGRIGPTALLGVGALLAFLAILRNQGTLRLVSALALAIGLTHTVVLPPARIEASPHVWATSLAKALDAAKVERKVAMVDLYADWCAACKELDAITFRDSAVGGALQRFALGRVDFTLESPEQDAIVQRYAVAGLPCILFLNPDGSEVPDSRILGFLPPTDFLAHLDRVEAALKP